MYISTKYASPLGLVTLAADGKHLVGLWIEGQKYYGGTVLKDLMPVDTHPVFETVTQWLDRYFRGENPAVSELPLHPCGSEFRQNVWNILCEIPYGQITTYGEIAKKVAAKMGREHMPGRGRRSRQP